HLTGNLNHFVGARLGGTDYVRDREREFTETNHPLKAEALTRLEEAVALFRRAGEGLPAERFTEPHPAAAVGAGGHPRVRGGPPGCGWWCVSPCAAGRCRTSRGWAGRAGRGKPWTARRWTTRCWAACTRNSTPGTARRR